VKGKQALLQLRQSLAFVGQLPCIRREAAKGYVRR
jgi:hypothetical protein